MYDWPPVPHLSITVAVFLVGILKLRVIGDKDKRVERDLDRNEGTRHCQGPALVQNRLEFFSAWLCLGKLLHESFLSFCLERYVLVNLGIGSCWNFEEQVEEISRRVIDRAERAVRNIAGGVIPRRVAY